MDVTIKNGVIECSLYGSLTAIDCDSLQGKECTSCFIYEALKDQPVDIDEFYLREDEDSSEIEQTLN